MIHRRDSLRASKILQDKALANEKISFEWESEVVEVRDPAQGVVSGVVLKHLKTGAVKELAVDGVFVAIGHTPNTSLFEGRLNMDPRPVRGAWPPSMRSDSSSTWDTEVSSNFKLQISNFGVRSADETCSSARTLKFEV